MSKKKQPPYCVGLEVRQWHERDRAHVAVYTAAGRQVAEWWDDEVGEMITDGFFKPGWKGVDNGSVLDYCASVGLCRKGTPKPLAGLGFLPGIPLAPIAAGIVGYLIGKKGR